MPPELKKITPVALKDEGLSEKWLQDQIQKDTSILGLGELEIIGKEHRQISGGRIDFLMYDDESDLFYEIEIMLGTLNESHIIRTIEYWDVERQLRPTSEHRAVIVAESITSRFFNVLRLLNRSVPMIAVQLSAFKLDDSSIVLHAVTVLDVVEEVADPYAPGDAEPTDRNDWEKKRPAASLGIMDKIVSAMKNTGVPGDISYKKANIPLGSTGNNFCWFHPGKTAGYCHLHIKLSPESRDAALAMLQAKGIDASPRSIRSVAFSISTKQLDEHLPAIIEVLKQAEELSK